MNLKGNGEDLELRKRREKFNYNLKKTFFMKFY